MVYFGGKNAPNLISAEKG